MALYSTVNSDKLRERVAAYFAALSEREPDPTPHFDFTVGWCANFDDLLRGVYSQSTTPAVLAETALASGRVLLSARGGAAKTVILRRLASRFLEEGGIPVIVDVKQWSAIDYRDWKACRGITERMDILLTHVGSANIALSDLDGLEPAIKRLVIVDGLNEVSSQTGQEILDVLGDFIKYAINTGIIVADRLLRRDLRDEARWKLATVEPLAEDEIVRLFVDKFGDARHYWEFPPSAKELLQTPYFLNLGLDDVQELRNSARSNERLFLEIGGLSIDELDLLSTAAYEAYKNFRSRTFPFAWLQASTNDDIVRRLEAAGILQHRDDTASFRHHLEHDYLVSRHAALSKDWSPAVLTDITFSASSFDVLSMTLQQLSNTDEADMFVRKVYDWNLYGSAYAITEGRLSETETTAISAEMQVAVMAMLAMRKWEIVESTRQRAKDSLALFAAKVAQPYLDAPNHRALLDIVRAAQSEKKWFKDWQALFTTPSSASIDVAQLDTIRADDILGWTFANILRRMNLSDAVLHTLRGIALSGRDESTIRWRVAHVLGRFPTAENLATLQELLRNNDSWVRFGAIRAIIENAAYGSKGLREAAFADIEKRAPSLLDDEPLVREFRSAVFIDPKQAPPEWRDLVSRALEAFYACETTLEKRDIWLRLADQVQARFQPGSVSLV